MKQIGEVEIPAEHMTVAGDDLAVHVEGGQGLLGRAFFLLAPLFLSEAEAAPPP